MPLKWSRNRAPGIAGLLTGLLLTNLLVIQLATSDSVSRWVTDWQDARIETVLREKIAPLLADLRQARGESDWQRLVRQYQDRWRVPVDLLSLDHMEIENWHRMYLDKGIYPVVLIDSFNETALIRVSDERVILAGAFVESAFWKHIDSYLLFLASALFQAAVVWFYQRWLVRRLRRVSAFMTRLARGGPVETRFSDPHSDALTQLGKHSQAVARKMLQAQQQQEQVLTVQRELLHGVAHELRGPMARIQFAIELLRTCEDRSQCERLWQQVEQALQELDQLVSEVLDYARVRAMQFPLHRSQVELLPLLRQLERNIQPVYPHIHLELAPDHNAPATVWADERQLGRVLINLMRNAARHATAQVQVRWMQQNHRLVLLVDDDGPGIPENKRDLVFEPFVRLDHSRARDSGGAGLGLAIARGIVERHGGHLQLNDSPLGGACFRLELPLAENQPPG